MAYDMSDFFDRPPRGNIDLPPDRAFLILYDARKGNNGTYNPNLDEKSVAILKWALEEENREKLGYAYLSSQSYCLPQSFIVQSLYYKFINGMNDDLFSKTPEERKELKKDLNAFLKSIIKSSLPDKKISFDHEAEIRDSAKKLSAVLDKYEALISGEWASLLLARHEIQSAGIKSAFSKSVYTGYAKEVSSPFVSYDQPYNTSNNPLNFYLRPKKGDAEEQYCAALYDISHRLVFDPLSTSEHEFGEAFDPQFRSPFFVLFPSEIESIKDFSKTKKGRNYKKNRAKGKTTSILSQDLDIYSDDTIYSALSNSWRDYIFTDARYTAICKLFMTPPQTSIEEKAKIIFGDNSPETLRKINDLLSFHCVYKKNTERFFLTHEINYHFINRSIREVDDIVLWLMRTNFSEDTVSVIVKTPEAALIMAREYGTECDLSSDGFHIPVFDEQFLKINDKEIMRMRFGDFPILLRSQLKQNMDRITEQYKRIGQQDWAIDLQKEIETILGKDQLYVKPRRMPKGPKNTLVWV